MEEPSYRRGAKTGLRLSTKRRKCRLTVKKKGFLHIHNQKSFRKRNKEDNQENTTPGETREFRDPATALAGGSSSNAEVTKTKRTPKPRRPKSENAALPQSDSDKRKSRRILRLQELKQKQEEIERMHQMNKVKRAERERERQKRKEDKGNYLNFIVDMSPQYAVLPGKRQRMFRQAAIMLMNELMNEQEAEEGYVD